MGSSAKFGPAAKKQRTRKVHYGIVLWIQNHQGVRKSITIVVTKLRVWSLEYGSQNHFYELEL